MFSLWDVSKCDIASSPNKQTHNLQSNLGLKFQTTLQTAFMDTVVYKSERFRGQSILDIKTHFKPTETFQYTHFSSSHPPGVKKGFVKREAQS